MNLPLISESNHLWKQTSMNTSRTSLMKTKICCVSPFSTTINWIFWSVCWSKRDFRLQKNRRKILYSGLLPFKRDELISRLWKKVISSSICNEKTKREHSGSVLESAAEKHRIRATEVTGKQTEGRRRR